MAEREFKYTVTVRTELHDEEAAELDVRVSVDAPEVAEATMFAVSEALEHFQRVGFPRDTDVGEALSFQIVSIHAQK